MAMPAEGSWQACTAAEWSARRAQLPPGPDLGAAARAAELLAAIRGGGPDALLRVEAGLRADPGLPAAAAAACAPLPLSAVEVPAERLRTGLDAVPPAVGAALRAARDRLVAFLAPAVPRGYEHTDSGGNRAALEVVPLQRIGAYVPGGRAPYVSSVLMTVVPARVAGVAEVVLCTPARPDGGVEPAILAAATVAGVDRLFLLGAVPALAALAYGLGPVPACDKVVGPGNAFVVAAKRLIAADVGIDGLPGPSEIVVLASAGAEAAWVAADLLAQAEHGPDSLCLLVSPDAAVLRAVGDELARQAAGLPARRRVDALEALRRSGGPVLVPDLDAGLRFAEGLAPEHLSLQGGDAEALLPRVRNAGAVFVGPYAPVAAGDYAAGTDHVLPTAGTARFASGLGPADFVRRLQVFCGSPRGAALWAEPGRALAEVEGFSAHAASLALRATAHPVAAPPPAPVPYVPPVPPGAARLDLNENPFPWPEELWREVQARLRASEPSRYPRETEALQAELAGYADVPPEWCLPANGSDELLLAVAAAWGRRAVRAVFPTPTFGMYRRLALACGLPVRAVPLGPPPDFALPVEAILEEAAGGGETLLLLCRPNNPTGTLWPAEQVLRLVEAPGVWAVVDEAYVEFAEGGAPRGLVDWLPSHPRLCLLRTLSKAFALAGLRVGYALGRPDALAPLRAAVQPWAVSAFSCAVARLALERRLWMESAVRTLVGERERVRGALAGLPGLTPHPSCTNYLLFGVDAARTGVDAFALFDHLYARGVVLRRWRDEPALRHCLRASVGTPEENDRLLRELRLRLDG